MLRDCTPVSPTMAVMIAGTFDRVADRLADIDVIEWRLIRAHGHEVDRVTNDLLEVRILESD